MIIYPAIDLKGGQCVRLYRGDMNRDTVYNDDPQAQARIWEQAGFSWIHIVDLDGAMKGASSNVSAIGEIVKAVDIPLQLGGGIRSLSQVNRWLEEGIARVILGTALVRDPDFASEACREFPGRIVVGLDARAGRIATEGWVSTSDIFAADMAKKAEEIGAAAIIYTDINRDGTGQGVNIEETQTIAEIVSIPVIASGGVGSLEDLRKVQKAASGSSIEGIIIGKALYDGRLDPQEALRLVR